jgi:hypothetical protein
VRMRVRRGGWAFSTTWAHGTSDALARVRERLTTAARAERWEKGQVVPRRAILAGDRSPPSDV